ncbi:MAG: hypothetical protein J6A77_13340 [Lachnospiraceae bacterium]|nr:hypothetical protein [Lachnospiraceae bacterium]
MKIRKTISTVLMLLMVMSFCACAETKGEVTEKTLYEHGMDVVALMAEAAGSEEYAGIYTGSPELMEIIKNVGEGDYSAPKAVYAVSVSEEAVSGLLGMENLDGYSAALKETLLSRAVGSLIAQINGYAGVNNLAVSSVLTLGKSFVDNGLKENVIYVYTFENGFPVAVTFTVGENGAVSAGGNFVMYEEFTCGSLEEVQAFFGEFGATVMEVGK